VRDLPNGTFAVAQTVRWWRIFIEVLRSVLVAQIYDGPKPANWDGAQGGCRLRADERRNEWRAQPKMRGNRFVDARTQRLHIPAGSDRRTWTAEKSDCRMRIADPGKQPISGWVRFQ